VQLDHSLLLYEFNELTAAMDEARAARETFEGYLLNRFQIDGCVIMARLKWTQGEIKEAEQLVQQAVDAARTTGIRQSFVSEGAWQAWLWLKIGKLTHATQWALAIEPTTAEDLDPAQEFEHITLARVQIAQGRLVEAEDLLARLFTAADHAGRIGRVIVIAALQAQVASLCGQPTTAMTALSLALQLAESEGYVRTFVDEGAIMQALLRTAKDHGMAAAYVTRLLDAFDHSASVNAASPEPGTASEFEPLSERELEVLALIAEGASNREIAEALFVSVGTVKKHLNNMFLKLDAHSRTEAIAIARQHNLL
jgi:LuxR family maltose regulon positive regulatory protein